VREASVAKKTKNRHDNAKSLLWSRSADYASCLRETLSWRPTFFLTWNFYVGNITLLGSKSTETPNRSSERSLAHELCVNVQLRTNLTLLWMEAKMCLFSRKRPEEREREREREREKNWSSRWHSRYWIISSLMQVRRCLWSRWCLSCHVPSVENCLSNTFNVSSISPFMTRSLLSSPSRFSFVQETCSFRLSFANHTTFPFYRSHKKISMTS
jgi:hypothetical protein